MNAFHPPFLKEVAQRIGLKKYPKTKQFVVQHLFADTLRLLEILHEYIPIDVVISISYSGSEEVVEALRQKGIRVCTPNFDTLHETIKQELENTLERCEEEDSKLLIHEVGGYTIKILHEHFQASIARVIGAIEVTKQGVWEARKLPQLLIPQLNCAETRLKQIEGKMVGEAVVVALDNILREMGYAVVGRKVYLLGYGWVGKGAALALRSRGMIVSVFDTDIIKMVEATVDGFHVLRSESELHTFDIVLGTSGSRSINKDILDALPSRCFLVSGSSKDHEIDLQYLQAQQIKTEKIHPHIHSYQLPDDRNLLLVNGGYPVNFTGSSVPDEIVEFLFAELIILVKVMMEETPSPGIYPLAPELEELPAAVWLEMR